MHGTSTEKENHCSFKMTEECSTGLKHYFPIITWMPNYSSKWAKPTVSQPCCMAWRYGQHSEAPEVLEVWIHKNCTTLKYWREQNLTKYCSNQLNVEKLNTSIILSEVINTSAATFTASKDWETMGSDTEDDFKKWTCIYSVDRLFYLAVNREVFSKLIANIQATLPVGIFL